MKITGHTPGPWRADRRCILAPPHPARCVAEVWSGACDTLAEADANERLIAAAPDLFAVASQIDELLSRQRWLPGDHSTEARLLRDARAAIAKVRGE